MQVFHFRQRRAYLPFVWRKNHGLLHHFFMAWNVVPKLRSRSGRKTFLFFFQNLFCWLNSGLKTVLVVGSKNAFPFKNCINKYFLLLLLSNAKTVQLLFTVSTKVIETAKASRFFHRFGQSFMKCLLSISNEATAFFGDQLNSSQQLRQFSWTLVCFCYSELLSGPERLGSRNRCLYEYGVTSNRPKLNVGPTLKGKLIISGQQKRDRSLHMCSFPRTHRSGGQGQWDLPYSSRKARAPPLHQLTSVCTETRNARMPERRNAGTPEY